MARFTDEWLSELLDKNDIVDVIGSYIPLNKRGATYWAKCPWHSETRPSFSVTPSKQMFYCFSCKKGGSVINFVMEYEKLNYIEAVKKLAERVSMELPEAKTDENYRKKTEKQARLRELMKISARFFHDNLKKPENAAGLQYIKKRGFFNEIGPFGLGYADSSFDSLTTHLKNAGFTYAEMIEAGVVKQKGGRYYDAFRDRVMFPIIDIAGNVIAFGGRIISDGDPKYLNSPETLLFNKRKNLYNLYRVKKQKDLRAIILCEGYLDVVALAAAGINVAVASLGTALTPEQARLIKRFVNKVYLCYDGDSAGIKAALRGSDILLAAGLNVFVITLPDGLDPDEIIKKHGVHAYKKCVKSARPAFEFKLNMLKSEYNINSVDDVNEYAKAASKMISSLTSEVEKERYIKYVAKETGIYENTLQREISSPSQTQPDFIPQAAKITTRSSPEDKLISLIVSDPQILLRTDIINEEDFGNELYKKIFNFISSSVKLGSPLTCAQILTEFSGKGLESLVAGEEIDDALSKSELIRNYLQEIRLLKANNKRDKLKEQLSDENSTLQTRLTLLSEIDEINKEIARLRAKNI